MDKKMITLKVMAFFLAMLLPVAAFGYGFVRNGNFEKDAYLDANDWIPIDWEKVETFSDQNNVDEISIISILDDNGPDGVPSDENAVDFFRTDGGNSGDWTAIYQDLDIDTNDFSDLELWLDIKAIGHNLCGGGWTGAWEYPISAVIHYLDSDEIAKNAQIGFYLETNNNCDASDDWQWWDSSNRWAKSKKINPNVWYTGNINLKDPDLDIAYITGITVGGTGWDFEGMADNVAIYVIIPIDIKPGSYPNSINLKSNGVLPVAILTTEDFDALTVDTNTIVFGDLEAGGIAAPVKSAQEDVDNDGDIDLIIHFKVPTLVANMALNKNSTMAYLTAETFNGFPIRGSDYVRIVPPKQSGSPIWTPVGPPSWAPMGPPSWAPGPPSWAPGPPSWAPAGFGGPPWNNIGLSFGNGSPWFSTGNGVPAWARTSSGTSWSSFNSSFMNQGSIMTNNNFRNGTIGFGGNGNGTLGPPWYQFNTGGPQWYQFNTGGPQWQQFNTRGPQWYQNGQNSSQNGRGRPW